MAIYIVISGAATGHRSWLCEGDGGNRKRLVATYYANMQVDGFPLYNFAVTRDTSPVIFGDGVRHYRAGGECPPSPLCRPYRGVVHNWKKVPFGIRLYDGRYPDDVTLTDSGQHPRTAIIIHHGPAVSEGCFLVEGGKQGFAAFRRTFESFRMCDPGEIYIVVEPRHFGSENPLSSL